MPCAEGVLPCKGAEVGPSIAEGERRILEESNGRVSAMSIEADALGEPEVVVDGLHFVNSDHGLNDLEAGPDGQLYLSVGNLDTLAWYEGAPPPDGEETALLGSVLRIDPETGDVETFATGFRNIYGLAFDEAGELWGVDNDGRGRGGLRLEELVRIEQGKDYGFPEDGSVGPYTRRTGFPTWIMPAVGSAGINVEDGMVISGSCGQRDAGATRG